MPPLRNAVRLVDCEQRNFAALQQRQRLLQSLGCQVEQIEFAGQKLLFDRLAAGLIERRVEVGGAHAELRERIHLVVHERDQRRDHHPGAGAGERGHLVAQRFAAAGWHEHEGITAGDDMVNDFALITAKVGIAPHPLQQFTSQITHGVQRSRSLIRAVGRAHRRILKL